MSYFLFNIDLAKQTNLIQSDDDKIQDLYLFMLDQIQNESDQLLLKLLRLFVISWLVI
jgi:hypothetical protein